MLSGSTFTVYTARVYSLTHVLPGEVFGVPDCEMRVSVVEKVDLSVIEGVVFEI